MCVCVDMCGISVSLSLWHVCMYICMDGVCDVCVCMMFCVEYVVCVCVYAWCRG